MNSNPKGPNKDAVERMFNDIARTYDPINTLLSFGIDRRWRKKLVRRVAECGASEILDLAAGTGEVTLELTQEILTARITAADLSEGMLDVAKHKLERKGLNRKVEFVVADAESLPFEDERFDCVTLSFGIRNFSAPAAAIAELYRTTSRGATIRIMEFGMPRGRLFGWFYRLYQQYVMPTIGGLLSGKWSAYRYLPASIRAFDRQVNVAQLLSEAGFGSVTTEPLSHGIAYLYTAKKTE